MTKKLESRMWGRLRPHLAGLDPHRIDVSSSLGVPDVSYAHGWIELKRTVAWPRRSGTNLRIPTLTPEQRGWGRQRVTAGGRCFLLLHIESTDDWLLFHMGWPMCDLVGASTRIQHEIMARWTSTSPQEKDWALMRTVLAEPRIPAIPHSAGAHVG